MKYGKYLASRQLELPEYSGHFIDYKALKKLIKHLAIPSNKDASSETAVNIHQSLKENKATFFFRVERELDKVNSFYLEKQANLSINLDLLLRKKELLFLKTYDYIQLMKNDATLTSNSSAPSSLAASAVNTDSNDSNFRNSISYLNLYQNFKKIHQDLLRLQQFIELNETGFSKVVKKWDKRSKSHTKELFILTAVSVQPVFHKNEINDLSDLVTQSLFDLESVMDGDYTALETFAAKRSPGIKSSLERSDSVMKRGNFPSSERHQSIASMSGGTFLSRPMINNQIDDLYSSFVNVATVQDPTDTSLLIRWIEKVKTLSEAKTAEEGDSFSEEARFKISRIFLLSLSNIRISDVFLESFLRIIDYQVDFTYVSDDFNNNRTIIHECCSIPPATKHEHVTINNGVRVVNANDYIAHSRTFIIDYIMNHLDEESKNSLLVAKDGNGRTCLHYAAQNSRLDILDIVLPHFPKEQMDDLDNESMSALLLAIKNQNFTTIQKLMEKGSNCYPESTETRLQYLPINFACQVGNYEILEYLLSFSKPDKELINQQDVEGLMPLHVVARSGNYKLIKLLIHYGAEINRLDGLNKWSPIFYAVLEGHAKTTEELVKLGARLNLIDNDGFNVLYYCVVEGHIDVLNELLIYKNFIFDVNEEEKQSLDAILSTRLESSLEKESSMSILDEGEDSEDSGSILKNNVDSIPDLQLPPPVLPLRRYGHNFLEQKLLIELIFPSNTDFIKFFDPATDLNPGRITLTSNISDIVPRNILLSVGDGIRANGNNCIFQTDLDSLTDFRIDFEIFPKFGTRLIAKTTALLFSQIDPTSPMVNSFQLPLFDLRLRNIGELKVHYQVIYPFAGTLLEASKFDTYWKSSTSVLKNRPSKLNAAGGLSPNSILSPVSINSQLGGNAIGSTAVPSTSELISGSMPSSVVTATSLSGEYLRIKICLLNDGTPVVCPHWSIAITDSIELFLPNLSLEQLTSITNSLFDYNKVIQDLSQMTIEDLQLIKSLIRIIYLPLDIVLDVLSPNINLNMEIMFPSAYELERLPFNGGIHKNLNNYIDFTLNDVFNHVRELKLKSKSKMGRSIIFLSSNSLICKILNWKQPNFPVFLIMSGISYSLEKNKFESRTTNGLLIDSLSSGSEMSKKKSYPGDSEESISTAHMKLHELQNDLDHQELAIRSIKEAVNFSINNNLIGIITSIHLLNLVPKMIPLVRSRGLILVAASDLNDCEEHKAEFNYELDAYTKTEINGLRFDDVLSFKEDITM